MIKIILALLFGYLVGSIPGALIIGRKLYGGKDIRQEGSGNLGATNAGRVLGKRAFFLVSLLDGAKGFLAYWLSYQFTPEYAIYVALGLVVGHCYPVFAQFTGGKGVATSAGILLAMAICQKNIWVFAVPLAVMVLILLTVRIMSLASMCAYVAAAITTFVTDPNPADRIVITLLCLFVIWRHRSNIQRLIKKEEPKFRIG